MDIQKTNRRFNFTEFNDLNHDKCSLQISSLATEDAIWFGIDNPKLVVFENDKKGAYIEAEMPSNFNVHSRMHLSRKQVSDLLPLLSNFSENGTFYDDMSNSSEQIDSIIKKLTSIQLNLACIDEINPSLFNDVSEKIGIIKEALLTIVII